MHSKGESDGGSALALEMPNVVGVFYVLSGGVVVAIILAFIVVLIETRNVCKENEVRWGTRMHGGLPVWA